MRSQLYAFTAAAALFVATPCLALTVQTTPNRDTVQHLQQQKQTPSAGLPAGFTSGDDRPGLTNGSGFSSSAGTLTPGVTTYGFGNVRTMVIVDPSAPLYQGRRETPAPLSLSPPRR